MDPVMLQLRFVADGNTTSVSVDEWNDLLSKAVAKLIERIKGGSSGCFLAVTLAKLLAPCEYDRSLAYEAAQSCNLPKLVPLICRRLSMGFRPFAECLAAILKTLPGPLGPQKVLLKRALVSAVDVTRASEEFSLACADCWGLLPFIGGGGNKGAYHRDSWNAQVKETLETLHQILSDLFTNIPGAKPSPAGIGSGLELESLPLTHHQNYVAGLIRRFAVVSEYFLSLLMVDSPVAVDFPVALALMVVERALSVDWDLLLALPTPSKKSKSLKQSTFARILAKYLPILHFSSLKLLRSIIVCCGSVPLFEFGRPIGRILANAFRGTEASAVVEKFVAGWRPDSRLLRKTRIEAYNCLEVWIEAAKAVAFPKIPATPETPLVQIWGSVWKDFTRPHGYSPDPVAANKPYDGVDEEVVMLWGLSRKERKQRKRKMGFEVGDGAGSKNRLKSRGNEVLTLAMLEESDVNAADIFVTSCNAVRMMVLFCGHRLASEMFTDAVETAVKILWRPEGEDVEGKSTVGLLQRRPDCRKAAYELLSSTSNATPASGQWLMPTSSVTSLLTKGMNDSDPEVSSFCSSTFEIFASAVIRPPCLTMEWSRKVPVVSENVNPPVAVQLAVDADARAGEAPRPDTIEVEGEEPIFVVDPPEVLEVSDAEEVMPSPPKPTPKSKRQSEKVEKEKACVKSGDSQDTVRVEDETPTADSVRQAPPSVQKRESPVADAKRTASFPPPSAKRQKTVPAERSEKPDDDLPSVLNMLAAFIDD